MVTRLMVIILKYWITRLCIWNHHNVVGQLYFNLKNVQGFPGGPVVKNLPCNAGETSLILGPGRSHMATKPVHRNYWVSVLQPMLHKERNHHTEKLQGAAPTRHTQRRPACSNEDPVQTRKNSFLSKKVTKPQSLTKSPPTFWRTQRESWMPLEANEQGSNKVHSVL